MSLKGNVPHPAHTGLPKRVQHLIQSELPRRAPGLTQPKATAALQIRQPPKHALVHSSQKAAGILKPPTAVVQRQRAATQTARTRVAAPVYRPQPPPRVLQPQATAALQRGASQPQSTRIIPAAHRLQLAPKLNGGHIVTVKRVSPNARASAARPVVQRAVVRSLRSNIVQATKLYPNLHPGAAVPVERSNIFSLDSFANQYRLHRAGTHGVNVPNMKYNFVRTREGQTLLHNRYRHPSLAEGQQVLYAGEVFFNNGNLEWWSNGSGHYQPDADGAEQANLPMDYFYNYQQVIKGEHTRKRG